MPVASGPPTPDPEINAILDALLEGLRGILGRHLIGMYLEGSLANGGFDQDSDIDFVAVTDREVSGEQFTALQALHERIAAIDSVWAIQLEGSYISQPALRRHDPALANHPNLERGRGERLKWVEHDRSWDIHRHILRERGLRLFGPDPAGLVDPLPPEALRRAVDTALSGWAGNLLAHPDSIYSRGYQSFIVLTMCRSMYTLRFGEIPPKITAAEWAKGFVGGKWKALIERAWAGRHVGPEQPPDPEEIRLTLEFIRYTLKRLQKL